MTYKDELINSIEPDFIFNKKPINRFTNNQTKIDVDISDKILQINVLKKLINSIENCNLRANSKNFVFADGNLSSPIMIIGEAPGLVEEKSSKTFQGDSGNLLKKMLAAIDIKIENIYCTYAINFRPPEDRKPTSIEIKRYSVFLKEHISIIDPEIIILLGSTAMEAITSSNSKISNERGKWGEIILKNKTYPFIITFNPSYLIRFQENKKYSWEDLKKIRKKLVDLNIKI